MTINIIIKYWYGAFIFYVFPQINYSTSKYVKL
jgi:hypothetical protein